MPDKPPSLYNLNKTTVWFAIASVVLLIGLVMMIATDSLREWKGWQRKFLTVSREKAQAELAKAEKAVDAKKIQELKDKLKAAEAEMKGHRAEIKKLEREIASIDVELIKARTHYQDLKQFQDSDRYFFEEHAAHGEKEKAESYEEKLAKREPEMAEAKLKVESLEAGQEAKKAALANFTEKEKNLKREMQKMTQAAALLENKISKLKQGIVQAILNAPMLDFIRPSLQIQQIVLENLQDDYYFAKTQKVDRCITCHLGIDQKGFEDAPNPFKTHPRLELFLSAQSPHPMEEIGCTVCHGGSGHSVDFNNSAHTPASPEQASEWKKKYGWHPMKHWGEKMLPLNHAEASCAKCHAGVVDIPQAPKLNEGRQLARTFGCTGCHKVEGFEGIWKAGPSLKHVQSKLEADWMVRWLQNPKEFRPSTNMPRIFHLENTSDPESAEKNNAAIAGIAAYLVKNSDAVTLESPPVKGNPETGEKLVNELGCLGCHTVGNLAASDHGPELSGLGSKVKADWLYTWLKNPKHYSPGTRMPSLRLTEEEASHITSYLLSQHHEKFESLKLPLVRPETVDDLALTFLKGRMRQEEARAALEKMNADERLEFVGKQSIAHQGCFACHDIKGFEDTKPIGTELTEEGSKEVEKLDFGFVPIDHTRDAWFFQKLKEPRIFDRSRVKTYHEKLRMPQFDFTDAEAEALTTFLLSLQKAEIPLEMQRRLSLQDEKIEAGRFLAAKLNCQGCHTLDGKEGKVRSLFEDKGQAPPIIDGEGKKVQPRWLYHFLESPTTIRPWLKYRMPTFGFSAKGGSASGGKEEEITALVEYFNALDQASPEFAEKAPVSAPEDLASGRELFQKFQCIKCHKTDPDPKLTASFLAPDLVIAKERLRPSWAVDWLKDPQALMAGTMMPGFFPDGQTPAPDILEGDAARQMKAIRDYLWQFTPEEAAQMMQAKPVKK